MIANWPPATRERPCPKCQSKNRCLIAPDGAAGKCWRDGGSVWNDKPANRNGHGTGYIGAAHRKPKPATKPVTDLTGVKGRFGTVEEAIAQATRQAGGSLAGQWSYPADVLRVLRFDLPDGSKCFRPIHQDTNGWRVGDPAGPLPLYKGDETHEPFLFVCEGEKAADAARSIGLPAVTSAHGSSAPDKSDWSPAKGKAIFILPDNDEPGEKYAAAVARILLKQDSEAKIRIVNLPGLPPGGDIVEYLAAGGTQEALVRLVDSVPYLDPVDVVGGPVLVCMADVQPVKMQWVWPGKMPLGRVTVVGGVPGVGKSMVTCDITARVTTGTDWPDGSPCQIGNVILICGEDDPGDTIRPRLDAAHADARRVHLLKMVRHVGDDGKLREVMFTLADIHALDEAMRTVKPLLVIIDPIGSFVGGKINSDKDNEVRAVLAPVAALAERYGAAVLIVAHYRKSAGASADDMILGSRAFTGLARSVLHLTRDPEEKKRRLLLPGKCNLAPEGTGLAFTVMGDPPALAWEPDPVTVTADEVLAEGVSRGRPAENRREAEGWLRAELVDMAERPVADLKAAAKEAGMVWRTIERAAQHLKLRSYRPQYGGGYVWGLPLPASHARQCGGQG